MNIIQCDRTCRTSGKLHGIPGIFSTLFLLFQIVFHRLGFLHLSLLWMNGHPGLFVHPQNVCQHIALVFTVHDLINEAMLQQKLCSLESLRQLLADRLLNDTRTCKSDQRIRLCQNDIAQHRKACCHTTGCRVCQYADKKLACLMVFFQRCGGFRHLHQGYNAFLHSCAAGAGKDNDRKLFLCRTLYHAGNFLTDYMSHATHDKPRIADTNGSLKAFDGSLTGYDGFLQTGLLLGCRYLLLISREIQWIGKLHFLIPLLKTSLIKQHLNPAVRMHTEVSAAFRANVQIIANILHIDRLAALVTLFPESLRDVWLFLAFSLTVVRIDHGICLFKHISKHK